MHSGGKDEGVQMKKRTGHGQIACAECRRLKLRCDRGAPCARCVARGHDCQAIRPDGSLTSGGGNRIVLANTEPLPEDFRMIGLPHALLRVCAIILDLPSTAPPSLTDSKPRLCYKAISEVTVPVTTRPSAELDHSESANQNQSKLPRSIAQTQHQTKLQADSEAEYPLADSAAPKKEPNSMIQGKEITIQGGNFTNVGGDYHEHRNTTYVIEERSSYLKIFQDAVATELRKLISFTREDNNKNNENDRTTPHYSPSCLRRTEEIKNDLDDEEPDMNMRSPSNKINQTRLNSLDDLPQPTSEEGIIFDEGYCIYETPRRIDEYPPYSTNSGCPSPISHGGPSLPAENKQPLPFVFPYMPTMVPGIVHYLPCWSWLPSWGGWFISWTAWMSPLPWARPAFL